MQGIQKKIATIKELVAQINALSKDLCGPSFVFFEENYKEVKFTDAELCFNQIISWLYIQFYEVSLKNSSFIHKRIQSSNVALYTEITQFRYTVHCFRTFFQHNLSNNKKEDQIKIQHCEAWWQQTVDKCPPESDKEWLVCLQLITTSAISTLQAFKLNIEELKKSEFKDVVLTEWERITLRNFSLYDFEQIAEKVFNELGLNNLLDPHTFTSKHYSSWTERLKSVPDSFVFEHVARQMIESSLSKQDFIPIDGRDLISIGIPTLSLTKLLNFARTSFYESPCSKAELIKRVQKQALITE